MNRREFFRNVLSFGGFLVGLGLLKETPPAVAEEVETVDFDFTGLDTIYGITIHPTNAAMHNDMIISPSSALLTFGADPRIGDKTRYFYDSTEISRWPEKTNPQ